MKVTYNLNRGDQTNIAEQRAKQLGRKPRPNFPRSRAVTIFAVSGVVCRSKNRASAAGGKDRLAPMR